MLTGRQLRIAAYVVGEEIARRQRFGTPVPQALRDTHRALLAVEVSASGQHECETAPGPGRLETAQQVAERVGVSARTIRRRAAANGDRRIAGRYLFERRTT